MKCPNCGSAKSRTVDSRLNATSVIRRRRLECRDCGQRYTTYEVREQELPHQLMGKIREAEAKIRKLSRYIHQVVELFDDML